ncbi:CocE/NonD family hydrolase [Nocardia sp. CA2R105]|nr:CocE/NonD family hydrolase [Nocardia coffeae]
MPMPDGAELLADLWSPRSETRPPTVLIRTPYGRRGFTAAMTQPLAERGFQVLVQSCRGTFGSGGDFEPMRNERVDGLATLDWIIEQPWFGEAIVLYGASYTGYVQWAMADKLPPQVARCSCRPAGRTCSWKSFAKTASRWKSRSAGASMSPTRNGDGVWREH